MRMIDWKQYDTILLDMDGTLLDLAFDNYFWRELLPRCLSTYTRTGILNGHVKGAFRALCAQAGKS